MDQMYLLLGPLRKTDPHHFHRFRLGSPSLVIKVRAWLELSDIRTVLDYQWAGCMNQTCTNLLRCLLMSAKYWHLHPIPSLRVVLARQQDAERNESKMLAA